MARKSRTALLERYARAERPARPSDTRDWIPVAELDLTEPTAVDPRRDVRVTRLMAGVVR